MNEADWYAWCDFFTEHYSVSVALVIPVAFVCYMVGYTMKVIARCALFAIALVLSLLNRG